jgi:hypothetical protein
MDTCKSSPLGKVNMSDWTKGLIVAVLTAVLTVIYDSVKNGVPTTWNAVKPVMVSALGIGLTAGIAYVLKNLGTGANGQILTNEPPKPELPK